jgi:hypothetical protein
MLSGFDYIRLAYSYILQNTGKTLVSEQALSELESAIRQFDDDLEFLLPGLYANPCSNIAARAALQSLQSSLRDATSSFRSQANADSIYLLAQRHNIPRPSCPPAQSSPLARLLDRFDSKITQLADALNALDLRMLDVFPQIAQYLTSLFMQIPPSTLQPALDDPVMRLFLVRHVF